MYFFPYDTMNPFLVKRKIRRRLPPYWQVSLLAEGLAIGALIHSGVSLVGSNQNALQGAVIGILAVMGTLLHSTLNALVCIGIHSFYPPSLRDGLRLPKDAENMHFLLCLRLTFFLKPSIIFAEYAIFRKFVL